MKLSHDWWFSIQSIAGWLLEDVPFPSAVRCVSIRLLYMLSDRKHQLPFWSLNSTVPIDAVVTGVKPYLTSLLNPGIYLSTVIFFISFSGGSRGEAAGAWVSPLFLDQNEARRAEKHFFETASSPPPPLVLASWYGNFKPRLVTLPNLG